MYWISAPASAGIYLDLSTGAVCLDVDYLQLKVMKLVVACQYVSDLTV